MHRQTYVKFMTLKIIDIDDKSGVFTCYSSSLFNGISNYRINI